MQQVIILSSPIEDSTKEYLDYFNGVSSTYPEFLKHFETPTSFSKWAKEVGLKIELHHDEQYNTWTLLCDMTEEQVEVYKKFITDNAKFHNLI